jgi:hypothetical protein
MEAKRFDGSISTEQKKAERKTNTWFEVAQC